jgi:Putative restriction endonuclease
MFILKPLFTLDDESFEQLCHLYSDFVSERMALSDDLDAIQGKLEEYRENGVQVGWLNHPESQQVHIYPSSQPFQVPATEHAYRRRDISYVHPEPSRLLVSRLITDNHFHLLPQH